MTNKGYKIGIRYVIGPLLAREGLAYDVQFFGGVVVDETILYAWLNLGV